MLSCLKAPVVLLVALFLVGPLAAQAPGVQTFRPNAPPNVVYQQQMYMMQMQRQQLLWQQQMYMMRMRQLQGQRPSMTANQRRIAELEAQVKRLKRNR